MLRMTQKSFPNFFPAHLEVPPQDAEAESFELLYRLASNNPAKESDFIPTCQEKRSKRYRDLNKDNPQFYGTSFFLNTERLDYLRELHPDTMGAKHLTSGAVCSSLGVSLVEDKHVSIWFYKGCFPKGFSC